MSLRYAVECVKADFPDDYMRAHVAPAGRLPGRGIGIFHASCPSHHH